MKLGRFEKITLLTMAVLALALAVLALVSYQIGLPEPQIVFPSESGMIGGRGPVEVRFQQEMERFSVESRLSFEPVWQGKWRWLDDRTIRFFPNSTLGEGTLLKLVLAEGARSRDGRLLRQPFEVDLRIRPASLVFLSDPLYSPELLQLDPLTGEKHAITTSAGRVFDFAVSPDGEKIVYSRINLRDGSDLVLINRDGSEEKVLAECGDYACIDLDCRWPLYRIYPL